MSKLFNLAFEKYWVHGSLLVKAVEFGFSIVTMEMAARLGSL
jgi:hypothetical protein